MLQRSSVFRLMLLLAGVLAFGGLARINGDPVGNDGTWFAVLLAIGWSVLSGCGCVPRLPDREIA